MNATEFQTVIENGVIALPKDRQSWNGKKIRVILLEDVNPAAEALPENESTTAADFFSCVGLWENRDISLQSIRTKAWRNYDSY